MNEDEGGILWREGGRDFTPRLGWTGLTSHRELLLISAYLDNMGEDED